MKRIFILDDDEDIIQVMTHILSKQYVLQTQTVVDGVYKAICNFKPDVIIVDNFIGEQNAQQILSQLRSSGEPVTAPVILFSAAHNISELAVALGAEKYLAKPASIREIRELIRSIVEQEA